MQNFDKIAEALKYIDNHLDAEISCNVLADKFYFSTFYFHKIFSLVVGKPLATYIRDRRILFACERLYSTNKSILDIALEVGFNSAQAFTRTFCNMQGLPPSKYREERLRPAIISADELVMKFRNRLKGGLILNPNIIKRGKIIIAGACGDGSQTSELWNTFEKLNNETPLLNAVSKSGYEIRMYDGDKCIVYVGYWVSDKNVDKKFSIYELPESIYASFEVYVVNGYESENDAMEKWLDTNNDGYSEKKLNGMQYCVECYDERFNNDESGSIVEIWVPIQKKINTCYKI